MEERKKIKSSVKKKIAQAMKGNTNAEKWTEEVVTEILEEMIEHLESPYEVKVDSSVEVKNENGATSVDDEGNASASSKGYEKTKVTKINRRMHLKGELLMIFKIRNVNWFNQMAEKFKNNEAVSCLFKYIDMACCINTYNDAANGLTVPSLAKMNLATHHNWADRVDGKMEHDAKVEVERPEVPEHILKAYNSAASYIDQEDE